MPTTGQHRTIGQTPERARMCSLAAAHLGLPSSEIFIQSAITAALMTLGQEDPVFALMLARSAGIDWNELQKIAKQGLPSADLQKRSSRYGARSLAGWQVWYLDLGNSGIRRLLSSHL
jgi:hypothetical protein